MSDYPVCPYCGEVDEDWADGQPPRFDGDSWLSKCVECEKEYRTTLFVSYDFETTAVGEKEARG